MQALPALALPGRHALPLPGSRQLSDEAGLLELRDGPQDLPDEDRGRGVLEEERRRADAAMRLMPFAFSMSCPASCTMRSRAKRSGLSTTMVRAPLDSRPFEHLRKAGPVSHGVRAAHRRVVERGDDLQPAAFA